MVVRVEPVSRILHLILWRVRATRLREDIQPQVFESDAVASNVVVQRLGKGWLCRSRGTCRFNFRIKRLAQEGVFAAILGRGP
jgi:hypothetical protein